MADLTTLPVSEIVVGERHRQDLGDIAGLAKSIRELGLLQPIVITRDKKLVAGRRRLEAIKELGWTKVDAQVVTHLDDALLALRAERDENTCRKDFTPSEAVAIGTALEALEKAKAKGRQARAGPTRGKGKKGSGSGKLPEAVKGDTRDRVAGAVGMSGRTYEKAKAVVEAAAEQPKLFAPVVEEMDRTGKVDPAFKQVQAVVTYGQPSSAPTPPRKAQFHPDHEARHVLNVIDERLAGLDVLDDTNPALTVLAEATKRQLDRKGLLPAPALKETLKTMFGGEVGLLPGVLALLDALPKSDKDAVSRHVLTWSVDRVLGYDRPT